MAGEKRAFPYYSAIPEISLKKRTVEGVNPGQEQQTASLFELPDLDPAEVASTTDFSLWTDAQIKGFLDQRGEDHEDCHSKDQLIRRASQCEYTTGPAKPPVDPAAEGDDPLDAFMAEMQQLVNEQKERPAQPVKADLNEEEDNVADFIEARELNGKSLYVAEGYNSDEEVYATDKAIQLAQATAEEEDPQNRQQIGPLAPLDHDNIAYEPFAKDFYSPAPEIASMTPAQVNAVRRQLGIRVSGFDTPAPVSAFQQLGLDAAMMAVIRAAKYASPTGIQAQALPAALSGRDVLGIAKTGSGKTATFLIPMFVHIQDQPQLEKGEGPIGVVAAPTRELAEQIHKEARKFGKPYNMRIAAGIGGLSKYEQFKDLKAGADAAICTPGRLIDLIKMKACTLRRATFLVFDEADRMFDMGFEPQVRSIIGQIRSDRQTLLFSATMPNKVERLVRDALTSPVRINVGEAGVANEDITQKVEVMQETAKLDWILSRLPAMIDSGEVLVFANQIVRVEEVTERLRSAGHRVIAIHGDMSQHSRAQALKEFSSGKQHVLVATDVAARGLDIRSIKSVVNLDAAKDIDTHVHRVGRTGRAGDKEGTAYTLLTPKQYYFAGLLVDSMSAANQEISPELQALAMKDPRFKKGQTRAKGGGTLVYKAGAKRRQQVGGAGIGFGGSNHDDPMKELYGDRAEFTKGSDLATPQISGTTATAMAAQSFPAVSPAKPVLGGISVPSPAATQRQPPADLPPKQEQALPERPGAGGVFGGKDFSSIMQTKFKSQFVASGTAGGDVGEKPTIIAPKARKVQEPELVTPPSYLAKKMNPMASDSSAQQAIAAARAIAARLAGGTAQPSQPEPSHILSQPQQGFPPPSYSQQSFNPSSRTSAGRTHLPAGFGSSASAYPDLSEDGSRDRSARHSSSGYDDRGARPQSRPQGRGSGGLGASASAYPDLSRDRDRGRGSGFSEGSGLTSSQAFSSSPAPIPHGGAYPSFAAAAPPQVQTHTTAAQFSSGQSHSNMSGDQGGLQASIAAAKAVAARLTAQAGLATGPPASPSMASTDARQSAAKDSVQASIEAARAIAARMGGGGAPVLGSSKTSGSSGQWAWGRG